MLIGSATSTDLYQQYQLNQKKQASLQEKLATGNQINHASDNPANLAVYAAADQYVNSYLTASQNTSDGSSAVQIADGATSVVTNILQQQNDLANQASNGLLNSDQRDALNQEYQSLSQEIDQISNSTNYNGLPLLNGQGPLADGTGKVQSGAAAGQTEALPGGNLTVSALGLSGTSIDSAQGAESALSAVSQAMHTVSTTQAGQGAAENRLNFSQQNDQSLVANGTQSMSSIMDTDYAQAVTNQVTSQILSNVQTAAIGQLDNLTSANMLALIGG